MGFWDNALRGNAPAAPSFPPVAAPPSAPVTYTPPSAPPAHVATPPPPPVKAMSARSDEMCPECGSGNIFKPHGHPNAMAQCYHCGWNPRFAHSTAGAGLPSDSSTPTRASRQVSTGNNFNPQTIVATIK